MDELPFQCEVLLIYVRQPHKRAPWGATLKNPRLVSIGQRDFIAGEMLSRQNPWWAGRRCHIAVDEIVSMFAIDSDYDSRPQRATRRTLRRFLR